MSVGAVLLQPERIDRAAASDDSPIADLVELGRLLVDEGAAGGPLAADVEAAFEGLAGRLLDLIADRGETVATAITERLQPLLAAIDRHVGALGSIEDPDDLALEILAIVDDLAIALTNLDSDRVGDVVRTVIEAVTEGLGLTPGAVRSELLAMFDDLATRLEQPRDDADTATQRRARDLARVVRRLRMRMRTMPVPIIDVDTILDELTDALRGVDLADTLGDLRCAVKGVREALAAGTSVSTLISTGSFGPGTVGAAEAPPASDDQHLWYATWLLGRKPWYLEWLRTFLPWPDDEVWIESDRVVRRHGGEDVEVAPDTNWRSGYPFQSNPDPGRLAALGLEGPYTFGRKDELEDLEQIAHVSAIVAHALESVLHLLSLEEGDYASNAVLAAETAALALVDGLAHRPLPWWADTLLMRTVAPMVSSLEGMHTRASGANCFLMWLTLVGPDLGEMVAYRTTLNSVRDAMLSFLTLRNHEKHAVPGRPQPSNRLETAGFVAPFVNVFLWLSRERWMVPREIYGIENRYHPQFLGHWLGTAPVFGILGSLLGHVVTDFGIARAGDFRAMLLSLPVTLARSWLTFFPSYFLDREGITDGGRFNPQGADFLGYPDADTSPYRLPWTAGDSVYVGQGNQGFWSHSNENDEVYAYDFSMDQDEDVLAARAGTVYDFRDDLDDDSENEDTAGNAQANFVRIRHDQDGGPIAGHDRDENGATITYASYLHGRQGSVTAAFPGGITTVLDARANPSLTPTTVARGQVIMGAGDTGKSFHNHLHMEVHPDNGSDDPNRNVSLPFVFREVGDRPLEKAVLVLGLLAHPENIHRVVRLFQNPAGVPTRFNFYTSENE